MSISATEARKTLFPLIQQVNHDRVPVEITSKGGDAVLISRDEYNSLIETLHIFSNPANAAHVLKGLAQARNGEAKERELIE
nr:type II toxin-antitoxin system prevent-host-death family antitoxin [Rhodococcus sp. (in: high G+C Gram-positive bacteria)]